MRDNVPIDAVADLFYMRIQLLKVLWVMMARRAKSFYTDPEDMLDTMQCATLFVSRVPNEMFLEHYGPDATCQHLEMEALQYLWRCRHKGRYTADIHMEEC
jgi:hypothetical protein